jgi:putative hydrolase of the HAD superfamily
MDAVIVDVGGVLLVPHHEAVAPALAPFGVSIDAEAAERSHYFGVRALDAAPDDERAARLAYLVGYAAAAGVADDQRDAALDGLRAVWSTPAIDLWRQHVRGSVDGLRQLKHAGLKLGIVSNADGSIEEQLRRGQICQVGEGVGVPVLAIIDSTIVGVAKPAAEIFHHALAPLEVEPERAVYVGDTYRYDVRGARAAGLVPVHFDPYELCANRNDHAHISALREVLLLFGA